VDWWENPTIDLVPQLKRNKDLVLTVKDRTGEIGCLRFNHLFPPFDNAAIRRVVLAAMDQKEVMTAVAGAEPSLIKTDVGLFVPGTPMASTVGVEITRGPKDLDKIKKDLAGAGYKGERVVVLAASTIPTIFAEAQVATDVLQRIGMNIDLQVMEWGSVVARRTSREPINKGGWNIFHTYLGGMGNISGRKPVPSRTRPRHHPPWPARPPRFRLARSDRARRWSLVHPGWHLPYPPDRRRDRWAGARARLAEGAASRSGGAAGRN
jgi:peptide/nickel transport system substrate-binding protein